MYLPSNATVATRGRLFSVFRNPRKALHLENKSSAYTPKSAGSALMIGKIALIMIVAVGMRCQNKLSPLSLPLSE